MPSAGPGATVHLLCGLNGAGKSTHARRLEQECGALRLSLDEWMIAHHPGLSFDAPGYGALAEEAKEALWSRALPVLAAGRDVVLDWNQWSRERRATWRDRALAVGCRPLLHVLEVDLATAVDRARRRAETGEPGSHVLAEEDIRQLASILEWPSAQEQIPVRRVRG